MDFKVVEYSREKDQQLLDLFYQSIFYNKKEFEYVRVPNNWIYRYKMSGNYITKIVESNNEIVASLGVIIRNGKIGDEITKIGCFVDNCILPKYLDKYDEIFRLLFIEIEKELKEQDITILCGWDFLKNINNHKSFFEKMGFRWIKGANWFSSGIALEGSYPYVWKTKIDVFWKSIFKLFNYYNKVKSKFVKALPQGIILRPMKQSDIKNVCEIINESNINMELSSFYDYNEFKKIVKNNNINGIVAEKDSEIVGVLTYITSAWSGWMFGKPFYDKNWQIFFGFTPDEFVVIPKYKNSTLPTQMLKYLMSIESSRRYNFVASIFDRRLEWRRKACLNLGFAEPKFDQGAILAKSLDNNIKLDPNKCWHLPARCIIAPVPSTQNLLQFKAFQ